MTRGRRGERHRPETLALVLTLRRPHVTESARPGKTHGDERSVGNAETHTDTSTGEARGLREGRTRESRRAAGGPGRAGADTKAAELPERACPPLAPAPPALTSGRLSHAPGGSWQ